MRWHCEPVEWRETGDSITLITSAKTDFWRRTHYGFIRDNGHFYGMPVSGNFTATVKVIGQYRDLYDQAGMMVRLDEANWMKCGIEYVEDVQNASVVVTRDLSDWSITPLAGSPPAIWLRVRREDSALTIEYSVDDEHYNLLRLAYLTSAQVQVGVMACSPEGAGFTVTFEGFRVTFG